MSVAYLTQRSAVNHPATFMADTRQSDDTLWVVCFEGRVRTTVAASDSDMAIQAAKRAFPGLLVLKAFPRA